MAKKKGGFMEQRTSKVAVPSRLLSIKPVSEVWKVLKKVVEIKRRQQQGIESSQEKAARSRLAKLRRFFSHRSGSGGGKHVDAQFVEEFNRFPDHEERQYGITHGFRALRDRTIARMGTSGGGGSSSRAVDASHEYDLKQSQREAEGGDDDHAYMTYDQLIAATLDDIVIVMMILRCHPRESHHL